MAVNLEYYKVFYHVARLQSVTAAAKELFISQPAVSQTIKKLEKELNVTLFDRRSKVLCLTKQGLLLYSYVNEAYEKILAGETRLKKLSDLEEGEINIGASDMTLQFYLLPYLEDFHKKYPKIKIRVTNATTIQTMEHLRNDKIDFGVVSEPVYKDDEIVTTPVRFINDVFIAGNKYSHLRGLDIDLSVLTKESLIMLEKNTSTRRYTDEFLKKYSISISPEFELATSDLIVEFVKRGLGIGCVVEDFAKEAAKKGELFFVKLKEPIPARSFLIAAKKNEIIPEAAKKLLSILYDF